MTENSAFELQPETRTELTASLTSADCSGPQPPALMPTHIPVTGGGAGAELVVNV